ncbi:hypothetical protein KZX45_08415 [Georgenia sp. EYE_87]|uniref:hypothetical protein n=1 Tax=Georgenia sp. EYE_87 TaxID=2853448 RepID=UPI002003EBA3|nr:hypothetical protein [Georgenia sp. EYE_87]MCK6210565.1 hypothetical protein [Georgenia sp. EYE_87]
MSFEPQFRYRRRWVRWIVAGILVVAFTAGALTWLHGQRDGTAAPSPAPTTATAPTATPTAGRVANGCLGGAAITAQTVLTAQQQAQLDDVGAAEFAATFDRWAGSDESLPPADEVPVVLKAITAPDAIETVTGLPARFEELGAPEEREGPAATTEGGGYFIESSTDDEVVVSVLLMVPEVTNQAGQMWAQGATYTLDRSTGVWLLKDFSASREVSDLKSIAQPFAGSC